MTASLHLGRRSRRPDASAMKPVVIARTAAIAAVLVLAGIGCNAGAGQSPTAVAEAGATATAIPPAVPTPRPASDAIATPAPDTPLLPDPQALKDRIATMTGDVPDEVSDELLTAEDTPEPAMDSDEEPDPDDPDGEAISAAPTSVVPTRGVVDAQGNLPQPEPGDALIDFTLPRAGGGEITLSEVGGDKNTVLVFYRAFW